MNVQRQDSTITWHRAVESNHRERLQRPSPKSLGQPGALNAASQPRGGPSIVTPNRGNQQLSPQSALVHRFSLPIYASPIQETGHPDDPAETRSTRPAFQATPSSHPTAAASRRPRTARCPRGRKTRF